MSTSAMRTADIASQQRPNTADILFDIVTKGLLLQGCDNTVLLVRNSISATSASDSLAARFGRPPAISLLHRPSKCSIASTREFVWRLARYAGCAAVSNAEHVRPPGKSSLLPCLIALTSPSVWTTLSCRQRPEEVHIPFSRIV